MRVTKAYKTNHFPNDGNISEEVLVLENGKAVYLNPAEGDTACNSEKDALALCEGKPVVSESLKKAWASGYNA